MLIFKAGRQAWMIRCFVLNLIWVLRPIKIISLILSQAIKVCGAKARDHQAKPPGHLHAEHGFFRFSLSGVKTSLVTALREVSASIFTHQCGNNWKLFLVPYLLASGQFWSSTSFDHTHMKCTLHNNFDLSIHA